MSTSDVTALMSALQTNAASGVKRMQADVDNSQSFQDYLQQNRTQEQTRARPAASHNDNRPQAAERARSQEARPPARQEAAEARAQQPDNRSDKQAQSSKVGNSKVSNESEPEPEVNNKAEAGSLEAEEPLESAAGVFVLKSVDAELIDNSSPLGFKLGQAPLQLESESLLDSESAEGEVALLAGVLTPATIVPGAQAGASQSGSGAGKLNLAAAATVNSSVLAESDVDSPATEFELADGADVKIDVSQAGKKTMGSALAADTIIAGPKNLADIKAADLTKMDGNKIELAASGPPVKAAIEHAQGASGLNHSYLTDRNAAVQGRAIMQSPMMAKQWDTEMAEKVAWFAAKNISSAEIRLDPPELGSLHIKISINQEQGQAQLTFISPHANVREALDQSASRLRELFDSQGLDLVDVDVSSQQQDDQAEQAENALAGGAGDEEMDEQQEVQQLTPLSSSLVDSYA